jgi:hypothetical protein
MGTDGCVRESGYNGVNVPNIVSVVSANSGMLAQCNSLNELSIPVYKDSSKQAVTQFLRELDSYFQIKGTPENLRLPLAIQAIEDKFAQEWISAIRHKLQSSDEFREQFSNFFGTIYGKLKSRFPFTRINLIDQEKVWSSIFAVREPSIEPTTTTYRS